MGGLRFHKSPPPTGTSGFQMRPTVAADEERELIKVINSTLKATTDARFLIAFGRGSKGARIQKYTTMVMLAAAL